MIKKYWFVLGLLIIFTLTVIDTTGTISEVGKWLKANKGPNIVIILIFFFSGIILNTEKIKFGLKDIKCVFISLALIFIIAPAIAVFFCMTKLDTGIKIGIFLVAVMPTTLSSGVVMTEAAGGNMAHALVITILSNFLSIVTIPVTLSFLLLQIGDASVIEMDRLSIMLKIAFVIVLPLCLGLAVRQYIKSFLDRFVFKLQILNQILVLSIVWMAVSSARNTFIDSINMSGTILLVVVVFHGIILVSAVLLISFFKIKKESKASLIFMGGQKTLPLSVILQVSLFPQYKIALLVCVAHHISHLVMDGWLVGRFKHAKN